MGLQIYCSPWMASGIRAIGLSLPQRAAPGLAIGKTNLMRIQALPFGTLGKRQRHICSQMMPELLGLMETAFKSWACQQHSSEKTLLSDKVPPFRIGA